MVAGLVLATIALFVALIVNGMSPHAPRGSTSRVEPPTARDPDDAREPVRNVAPNAPVSPADAPSSSGETAAPPATPAEVYRAHMAEARKALLAKGRYPNESQSLATKTDLLLPHHVEPTMRGLSGGSGSGMSEREAAQRVRIAQHQDRLFVMPGQDALASFEAMSGGKPANINITRSDLIREGKGGAPPTVVGHVNWKDDGVKPDELPGDGTWTGVVEMPKDGVAAGLTLAVDIESNGEKGTLAFQFVQTASPPAKFTQTARWAIEDGSVVFYVGIQIDRPGLYDIVARVYDNVGTPVTYCRYLHQLTPDVHEVRLLAFGALLLDEGAVPPLVLRDVEGHRLLPDTHPDRELLEEWPANFKTGPFDVHKLSSAPYKDPTKPARIEDFDRATAAGLANTPGAAPAASH